MDSILVNPVPRLQVCSDGVKLDLPYRVRGIDTLWLDLFCPNVNNSECSEFNKKGIVWYERSELKVAKLRVLIA